MGRIPIRRASADRKRARQDLIVAWPPSTDAGATSEPKWPRWKTWAFAVGSSVMLWAIIIVLMIGAFALFL